jgi:S-ribosylhomocysteine lyase
MDLDHRTVQAPYLRLTETYPGPQGDVLALWHLRIEQPNTDSIRLDTMHSLEHGLIYGLRLVDPRVRLAAPMGCRTGLYIIALNVLDYDEMESAVVDALTALLERDTVPWADEAHCGMYVEHDLKGAQELATALLERRDEWATPGPNAVELTDDAPERPTADSAA